MPTVDRRRAFTLIELLVVVAIIAILAALILPALAASKDRARSILCLNNLRQYGMSVAFYLEEQDNWITNGRDHVSQLADAGYVPALPARGVPHLGVCPTEYNRITSTIQGYNYQFIYTTYGTTEHLSSYTHIPTARLYFPLNPTWDWHFEKMAVMPQDWPKYADSYKRSATAWSQFGNTSTSGAGIHLRHLERANITFMDGRAESVAQGELMPGSRYDWYAAYNNARVGYRSLFHSSGAFSVNGR